MPRYALQAGPVALSGGATKSLILVNPNIGFRFTELAVMCDSATAAQAIRVDLYRTTTTGTPAGTTGAPVLVSDSQGAPSISSSLVNLTAEPTAVAVIKSWYLSPAGQLILPFDPDNGPHMSGQNNFRMGIRVTTPASVTPNCIAYVEYQE